MNLITGWVDGASGWNIKPHVLLAALDAGAAEAWWIDSDVIVTDEFPARYAHVSPDRFIVAEEALYGTPDVDAARARAWGFEVRRALPFCLNSGVLRATADHSKLLRAWIDLLGSTDYLAAQRLPAAERPVHLVGDQDVLTACLTGPMAAIPLHYLRRGQDIIQYFGPSGYTPAERWYHLRHGMPPFIHSMGATKPWRLLESTSGGARERFDFWYAELSPYKVLAQHYKEEFAGSTWMDNRPTVTGRLLRLLGFNNVALTGLPLAVLASLLRFAKTLRARTTS